MSTVTTAPLHNSQSLASATVSPNVIIATNHQVPATQVPSFDPHDENSWFFGFMSRADAAELLSSHNEVGSFLVRESTTVKGDLVLSVKENNDKISHYIIYRLATDKGVQVHFKIGDHIFPDIPALLKFYKNNYLDDTPLICPAAPKANSIFSSNANRRSYTNDYLAEAQAEVRSPRATNRDQQSQEFGKISSNFQRELPSKAVIIQSRVPNAYDKTALALREGQIVTVTKVDISGCWEGEIDGRVGHFPFNYVKFIDDHNDLGRKT